MIYGNIDGIRKSALDELESLYKAKTPKDEVCSLSIMETISRVSSFIEREISVAIDRRGNTVSVAIGDSTSVEIPTLDIREKKFKKCFKASVYKGFSVLTFYHQL